MHYLSQRFEIVCYGTWTTFFENIFVKCFCDILFLLSVVVFFTTESLHKFFSNWDKMRINYYIYWLRSASFVYFWKVCQPTGKYFHKVELVIRSSWIQTYLLFNLFRFTINVHNFGEKLGIQFILEQNAYFAWSYNHIRSSIYKSHSRLVTYHDICKVIRILIGRKLFVRFYKKNSIDTIKIQN